MKVTTLIHCPDRKGIISSVTGFFLTRGGNVVYLDQHVDKQVGVFFMRLECEFDEKEGNFEQLQAEFQQEIVQPFSMQIEMYQESAVPRMALFVSKYLHCLYDILSRVQSGEWQVEIPFILSNHEDAREVAGQFGIPFYYVPVSRENKEAAEEKQLQLLREHQVDFVILARYMQIVSSKLIGHYHNRIINIHHSFLPAFVGAKPYHAAFERGVKIIGATSHYVTEDLDAGPIIDQDVTRVTHAHTVKDFIAKGRDLEKMVLSRAIHLHLLRKTMVYNNKTVIFA